MTQATDFRRRSFCYRRIEALGPNYAEANGGAVALDFGDAKAEIKAAKTLGLADLSVLPRTGFKGAGTADWLAAQGVAVPENSNCAARQDGGALAARLAPGELLILDDESGEGALVAKLNGAWSAETRPPETPRGFPVPRQDSHAWFMVTGEKAAAMFAKICAVDLRPQVFADLQIAQTSVARLSAVIIRNDRGGTPAFHLLFDSASATYLWDVLIDAMEEFGGRPVGLDALRGLAAKS